MPDARNHDLRGASGIVGPVEPNSPQPGWHPDPTGRFEFRYFNGERWTADVSLHGQRYVDPAGVAPPAATGFPAGAWAPAPIDPTHRKGFAITSFVLGLGALATGWIPFVFVLGAVSGIVAIVLGIVALRRIARSQAGGRSFAIIGILLSVLAFGACVVGFNLTRHLWEQITEFVDPGPNTTTITSCTRSGNQVTVDGRITNLDTVTHDYLVNISYVRDGSTLDTDSVSVDGVEPGKSAPFHAFAFISESPVSCEVDSVTGPAPFVPES